MPPDDQAPSIQQLALSWRDEDIVSAWMQIPHSKPDYSAVTGFGFPLQQPIAHVKVSLPEILQPEVRNHEYFWGALRNMPPDQTRGIRIPEIYRTFQSGPWFYSIMELIPGKTLRQLIDQQDWDESQRRARTNSIARAMEVLMSIPVPEGQTPGPVGGGHIRHDLFKDDTSYCIYSSVDELEKHLNDLSTIRNKAAPTVSLERNLCFYYSDFYASNFIFTDSGDVCVIDFDRAGFLPLSFMTYALAESHWAPGLWVSEVLKLPEHNLPAMKLCAYYFMIGTSSIGLPQPHRQRRREIREGKETGRGDEVR